MTHLSRAGLSRRLFCDMQMTGAIPASFPSAPHLFWQDYGYNQFSGTVPSTYMCIFVFFEAVVRHLFNVRPTSLAVQTCCHQVLPSN